MSTTPAAPVVPIVDLNKLKVPELRTELTNRGLDSKGNKPELIARLAAAMGEPVAATATAPPTVLTTTPTPTPAPSSAPSKAKVATPPTTTTPVVPVVKPAASTAEGTPTPTELAAPDEGAGVGEGEGVVEEEGEDITQLSELERRKRRVERFGTQLQVTEADKKKMRIERFGDVSSGKKKANLNLEGSAAQRLGLPVRAPGSAPVAASAPSGNSLMSEELLAKRRAKFGNVEPEPASTGGANKGKGKARVLSAEDQEKLQKRKERFATPGMLSE